MEIPSCLRSDLRPHCGPALRNLEHRNAQCWRPATCSQRSAAMVPTGHCALVPVANQDCEPTSSCSVSSLSRRAPLRSKANASCHSSRPSYRMRRRKPHASCHSSRLSRVAEQTQCELPLLLLIDCTGASSLRVATLASYRMHRSKPIASCHSCSLSHAPEQT